MVSGGSDSTALLELATLGARNEKPEGPVGEKLMGMYLEALPEGEHALRCLHINHLLRGEGADNDERFVERRCGELGVECQVRRIDVGLLASQSFSGMEAVAREQRYLAARELAGEDGLVLTAHTLDDRVETYLMRTLVGTGPGGLGSIPRRRGNIIRPLLDATRQELREFLREQHPGAGEECLWRDDPTNDDGSNFRSRVRTQLVPAMRQLQPGFEHNLSRTMDLIAEEDAALASQAESFLYRNLQLDGNQVAVPVAPLKSLDRPMLRRVLRQALLVANPAARLESRQIERIADAVATQDRYTTEVDTGIKVWIEGGNLTACR